MRTGQVSFLPGLREGHIRLSRQSGLLPGLALLAVSPAEAAGVKLSLSPHWNVPSAVPSPQSPLSLPVWKEARGSAPPWGWRQLVVRDSSKQTVFPPTYPGELFAVTSNFLPPKKNHVFPTLPPFFFFFPFKLKCLWKIDGKTSSVAFGFS